MVESNQRWDFYFGKLEDKRNSDESEQRSKGDVKEKRRDQRRCR